ncbi:NAD(P)/FAD-dependent oxidoreductase [Rosistilla oblonga]|uniref:NAD(P)/FAD-dependent oxidoreductase n=1 Tax=Rosistilla oblonga TaxID=2527990 RepID=UPI003A9731EF
MQNDFDIVVIGAGAAGMMAAAEAARRDRSVCVLEKANKAGVKILMSGGTRCNVTHDCDAAGIMEAFGKNGRFLRQALAELSPTDVVQMFRDLGVPTKVEPGGKIFPESDRALDVCQALQRRMTESGATLRLGSAVQNLSRTETGFRVDLDGQSLHCRSVIVTVGGMSYPGCGTVGDGYNWLQKLGHTILTPRPSLVPIVGGSAWTWELQGLTLPEAQVTVGKPGVAKKKGELAQRTGGLLFTHFGFSGPTAMDVSRAITAVEDLSTIELRINALPGWNDDRLNSWFDAKRASEPSRQLDKALCEILPRRLASALIEQAQIAGEKPLAELSGANRRLLVEGMLRNRMPIQGTRGFKKAEVTAGGVSLKEVDPRTMHSRIVDGLYIAGEILDLDGWIGGYNFQSAFSTGTVAGRSAAESLNDADAGG